MVFHSLFQPEAVQTLYMRVLHLLYRFRPECHSMVSTVFDRKHEAVCIQTSVPVHEVNIDFIIDLVYSEQSLVFLFVYIVTVNT